MTPRLFLCALVLVSVTGCNSLNTPYKKKDEEEKKPMRDQSSDQSFMAFLGRLRLAVAKRDKPMIASMMTPDFGYRWDNPPAGETPFDYWDKQKLWGDLSDIIKQRFVPNGLYMVSPPQVVLDPKYTGYRVGLRVVNGSWKFGYFVPVEPAQ
jgi:hypothetical protein